MDDQSRLAIGGNNPPFSEALPISEATLVAEVQAIADRANQLPKKLVPKTVDADISAIGGVVSSANALWTRVEARRVVVKAPILKAQKDIDDFFTRGLSNRLERIISSFENLVREYRDEQRREAARIEAEVERRRREEAERQRRIAAEAEAKGRQRAAALAAEKTKLAEAEAADATAKAAAAVIAPVAPAKVNLAPSPSASPEAPAVTMATKGEWVHEVKDFSKIDLLALRPYIKGDHIDQAIRLAIRNGIRSIGGVDIFQRESVKFR